MSKKPYRTHINSLEPEEVQRLNQDRPDDQQLPIFPQAWSELQERGSIINPLKELSAAELEMWVTHPDERFPLKLARNFRSSDRRRQFQVADRLLARVRREQRQKGHLWSPLVDAMAQNKYRAWPDEHDYDRYGSEEELPDYFITIEQQVANLETVLSSRQINKEYLDLLEFRDVRLAGVLARNFVHPTPGFLKLLLEEAQGAVSQLAFNSNLSPSQYDRLSQHALAALRAENDALDKRDYGQREWGKGIFEALNEADIDISENVFRELGEMMASGGAASQIMAVLNLYSDQMSEQLVADMLEKMQEGDASLYWLRQMMSHPKATAQSGNQILSNASGQDLYKLREFVIDKHPEWLDHESIRKQVLDTSSSSVIKTALQKADGPKRFKEVFHHLLSADFQEAIRLAGRTVPPLGQKEEEPDWLADLTADLRQACRKRVFRKQSGHSIAQYLSKMPGAREDMEVRDAYLDRQRDKKEALLELCQDARGEEMKRRFARLSESFPRSAIELLEQDEVPGLQDLDKQDLLPLFQLSDSELRQRALLAVKSFKPGISEGRSR